MKLKEPPALAGGDRRPPRGGRGLKSAGDCGPHPRLRRRPPRGGRGLKLIHNRLRELAAKVAPREGGVD